MWSVIAAQVVTLTLAMLGALLGVIFTTRFIPGQQLDPDAWRWIGLLGLFTFDAIAYLVADARAIARHVKLAGRRIQAAIDRAGTLEYNIRDGAYHTNAEVETAIEAWRNRVEAYLARNLPGSGADVRFRTGIGEVGPGHAYEHTRLKDLKQNLVAILDALPSYVQRSR